MYTLKEQIYLIVVYLSLGITTLVLYQTFSYFLNKLNIKMFIVYIADFLFFILLTILAIKYLLNVSDGYVPLYGMVFLTGGFFVYFKFLKKEYIKDLKRLEKILFKFFKKSRKLILSLIISKEVINTFKKISKRRKK